LVFVLIISGCKPESSPPLVLGSRLELFVDDFLAESLDNVQFRLHSPVDEGPVLWFEKPWEGPFSTYTTIIKDNDLYSIRFD
jgi:hypothetical protein